jgi:hypothetical protein
VSQILSVAADVLVRHSHTLTLRIGPRNVIDGRHRLVWSPIVTSSEQTATALIAAWRLRTCSAAFHIRRF